MSWELLSASKKTKGVTLDPRTKLIVLITICFLVLGGEGGGLALVTKPMLTAIPILFWKKESGSRLRNHLYDLLFWGTVCCACDYRGCKFHFALFVWLYFPCLAWTGNGILHSSYNNSQ